MKFKYKTSLITVFLTFFLRIFQNQNSNVVFSLQQQMTMKTNHDCYHRMNRRNMLTKITSSFIVSNTLLNNNINVIDSAALAIPTLDGYEPNQAQISPQSGRSYFPTITPPFQNRATYRYKLGRDA